MGFVVNGYMQIATITGGGWDDGGDPIPGEVSWGNPIPCHIDTVTHRNDGRYDNGKFTEASYRVFCEMYGMDCDFYPLRVRLNHNGKDVGEWQVQDVQFKPKTGRIQIIVGVSR